MAEFYISPWALDTATEHGIETLQLHPDRLWKVGEYLGNPLAARCLNSDKTTVILSDADEYIQLDGSLWQITESETGSPIPLTQLPPILTTERTLAEDPRREVFHIAVEAWNEASIARALYQAARSRGTGKHYLNSPFLTVVGAGISGGISIIRHPMGDPRFGDYLLDEHLTWAAAGGIGAAALTLAGRGIRAANRHYRLGRLAPVSITRDVTPDIEKP